jgi:CDP-diglyceride synthetase
MPTIYDLKPRFQKLLRPLNSYLVEMGVTANLVTLFALLLSVALGIAIALNPENRLLLLLMPIWLFFRMALNAIDGMLARGHQMKTNLGAVLNEMGDVASDSALYLPLAMIAGFDPLAVLLVVIVSIMVEMVGVASVQIGASRRYDGPLGKSDRAFGFGFLTLLLGIGIEPGSWSNLLLWIMLLLIPARMVLAGETEGFLKAAGTLHWGLMTTVFSLSHAAYLLALPSETNTAGGAGLLFFLVFLTQFNDVAQYTWGKVFGKDPVVPKVSPKKTQQGLAGGVLTTLLASWVIAPYLTPLNHQEALLAGLLIGLGGFLGDVVISAIKRDIGVKDSGSLIPGHGGIMDRVDSLTFTAPLFFHFLYYLHY